MLLFIVEGLQSYGHKVSVININTLVGFDRMPPKDVEVRNADIKYVGTIQTNYEWIRFVYKNAKELKSDILIGFIRKANMCAVVAGKMLGIPSIVCERSDPFFEIPQKRPLSLKINLAIANSSSGAIFQTKGAAAFYSKKLQEKGTIIPNPIDNPKKIYVKNYSVRPKTIVTHGRIDNKQKRLDVMIRGFSIFHKIHADYVLKIYGTGDDENRLRNLAKELDIENAILFMGKTVDPMSDISKEGIYAITSDYEGISNSLLEAMAVGLPVVSTDHSPGGGQLLITDHINGLLIPPSSPYSLAGALTEYADNPALAEKCGKEAKKVLIDYNPEVIIAEWNNYIENIYLNYNKGRING